jgi:acetyl-CoA synthetase
MSWMWEPGPEHLRLANVTRFMRRHHIGSYEELVTRSTSDTAWFWDAVADDLDLDFMNPYEGVLDEGAGVEWATWFRGGTLNVAANCVDRWAERTPDATSLIYEDEGGDVRRLSYSQLQALTTGIAAGLRSLGLRERDVVAIYMPMAPETVATVMACAKLGIVFLPLFSGFGAEAIAVRLRDSGARAVIAADRSSRKGRVVDMKAVVDAAVSSCPAVERVVVWKRNRDTRLQRPLEIELNELIDPSEDIETLELDAEHPLFIGYTSGTTGRPKGAVHVHGGFLVKIAEEVSYQVDLHPGEVLYWLTDLGWIMGPWEIIGATALGATIVLYEGAPDFPDPDRLWRLVERHRVTTLGLSPSVIRSLMRVGTSNVHEHDLSSLRILGSTGEPWNPEPYRWYFERVGSGRCPVINFSGGTEIGACLLSPLPIQPLKACSLGGPALGMDVQVRLPDGRAAGTGEVGELVCRKPWPSMTRGIWGDPQRYIDTYWSRWPGVWVHGDWARVDEDGHWFIEGRSDDTMSIAGKRVGPAEVEDVLMDHGAVAESAAVGIPHEIKGEAIWCFVVPKRGRDAAPPLDVELGDFVASRLGRAFKPERVLFVRDLPRTRSAKVMRRTIRAIAAGEDLGDLSSLENPSALDDIAAVCAADAR